MFGSFRIGRLLGIPLQVNFSWFIIFTLVTVSLIAGQFPAAYPLWDKSTYIVIGIATSLLFFASVIAHELAHSIVARLLGVPVRSITLFVFGGVAQLSRDVTIPAGELVMAAAGPMCSFALAALFALLWLAARPFHEPATALSGWLAWINLSLGLFNLVPGFPMDGGRVLRSLIWWATGNLRLATRIAIFLGQAIALLFVIGGIAMVLQNPNAAFNGFWLAFIGWFLHQAASGSSRQANFRNALQGYTIRNLMTTDHAYVPMHFSIQQFIDTYVTGSDDWWFVVVEGAHLRGVVSLSALGRVPQQNWDTALMAEVMMPVGRLPLVHPNTEAQDITEIMEDHRTRELLVVEDGQFLGLVTQNALFRLAQLRRRIGR